MIIALSLNVFHGNHQLFFKLSCHFIKHTTQTQQSCSETLHHGAHGLQQEMNHTHSHTERCFCYVSTSGIHKSIKAWRGRTITYQASVSASQLQKQFMSMQFSSRLQEHCCTPGRKPPQQLLLSPSRSSHQDSGLPSATATGVSYLGNSLTPASSSRSRSRFIFRREDCIVLLHQTLS